MTSCRFVLVNSNRYCLYPPAKGENYCARHLPEKWSEHTRRKQQEAAAQTKGIIDLGRYKAHFDANREGIEKRYKDAVRTENEAWDSKPSR
jgi:hypothetical protein